MNEGSEISLEDVDRMISFVEKNELREWVERRFNTEKLRVAEIEGGRGYPGHHGFHCGRASAFEEMLKKIDGELDEEV